MSPGFWVIFFFPFRDGSRGFSPQICPLENFCRTCLICPQNLELGLRPVSRGDMAGGNLRTSQWDPSLVDKINSKFIHTPKHPKFLLILCAKVTLQRK